MLNLSNLGFLSLGGSILIIIFQAIASLTSTELAWKRLRLIDILEIKDLSWIDGITLLNFNYYAKYILNIPGYVFLFSLTIIFFIMSGIFER